MALLGSGVWRLAQAAFPTCYRRPDAMMAIFKVYIDETKTKDGRMYGLAGCVSTIERWAALENAWVETLVRHKIPLEPKDVPYKRPSLRPTARIFMRSSEAGPMPRRSRA